MESRGLSALISVVDGNEVPLVKLGTEETDERGDGVLATSGLETAGLIAGIRGREVLM